MARGKKKQDGKRQRRDFKDGLVWVANNLNEGRLEHADKLAPSAEDLFDFLLQAVDAGIDIKISYDTYSDCYQATAIGAWEGADSSGFGVSSRSARDVRDAVVLIWYKVAIMAEYDLSSMPTEKETDEMRS